MIYVFDTNSLSVVLNHYYRGRFPSFWEKFDKTVREHRLFSVRECELELKDKFNDEAVEPLTAHNTDFFADPTSDELAFLAQIYSVPHFRHNLEQKKLLKGGYFADPFVIAKARLLDGTVVTEEKLKDNAAKIPNICSHFGIECTNLEGFMSRENWTF